MARPHLLLVDADPRVVRVLEVNLKNDGFSVTTATDGAEAAAKLEIALPDVLVAETRLSRIDGFELVRRLRALPGGENVAVVLIAPEVGGPGPNGLSASAMDQLRAVELGIADCLCKPVSVRELVTRVNLMLARRTQTLLSSSAAEQTHFSGHLQDIGVIDLLSAFESGRRSGVLQIEHAARSATVLFKNGKVVDAEQGQLRGEEALYRTLLWTTGVFDVEFVDVDAPDNVPVGTAALIMEGMRRIDEWGRLAEQLPSSASVFTVDADVLLGRLAEVPDELNPVLRLFDGQRSLMAVIDESPFDDLSTLSVVSKLFFEGVLRVIEAAPPSVLLSARALSAGAPKADGNVIRLPHAVGASAAIIVRPHAPAMSPDVVPRSLVYSEPPQSLRLSQRPKAATPAASLSGATLSGFPSVVPTDKGRGEERSGASNGSSDPVGPHRNVEPRRGAEPRISEDKRNEHKPAVAEAEFEDLSEEKREAAVRTAVTARTELSARETLQPAAPPAPAVQTLVDSSNATTSPSASDNGGEAPKAAKELDHDFFTEGDDGIFEAGHEPDEEAARRSRPDVDIDPRVVAALQARRDQGRRWATWIFGLAFILLAWGIFAIVGRGPDEEPAVAGVAASGPTPGVSIPQGSATASATPAVLDTAPVFEEVPPVSSSASKPPVGVGLGVKPAPGLETPPDLAPLRPTRGKKPPTARFPSTPDNQ